MFVWDASSMKKVQRFKLPKGARGINAVAIQNDKANAAQRKRSFMYLLKTLATSNLGT